MERILVICLSIAIGVGFLYWTTQALRRPAAKEYVMKHLWFCHPNSICYWRTALALIALPVYFPLGLENLGIMIFTFAAVLDGVDGVVARNCNLVTPMGESLDPLCDKLTYLPAMLAFAYRGQLSVTLVVSLIVIEMLGQFGARPMLRLLKTSGAANNFGKIKAMICFGLVIFCALRSANPGIINMGDEILVACLVLASASIVFKFVPNRLYADILSTLNFFCGLLSLYFASQGHFALAVCVIIVGQLFDLFDGRMAELHGGTKYGPYLDDIADFISFGAAPFYIISRICPQWYGWLVAAIFLGAVAFRLYRFVAVDKKRTDLAPGIFNGLPSPAGALLVLGAALFKLPIVLLVSALISAALMVSHLRFAHFGRIILKSVPRPLFFSLSAALIIIITFLIKTRSVNLFGAMILASCLFYLVIGRRSSL